MAAIFSPHVLGKRERLAGEDTRLYTEVDFARRFATAKGAASIPATSKATVDGSGTESQKQGLELLRGIRSPAARGLETQTTWMDFLTANLDHRGPLKSRQGVHYLEILLALPASWLRLRA